MGRQDSALSDWMARGAADFGLRLEQLIDEGGMKRSPRLTAAMKHAVLAGGKRLRPFLVLESARLCGAAGEGAIRAAAAVEFIHCYSLVHDDLPAMDNDDLRRGQPTVHRAYDEATAILAGDGLQALAFSVLADRRTAASGAARARLVATLALASGVDGMVGGQMLDLAAEGRFEAGARKPLGIAGIARLQGLKTGALILFSAEAGALLAPRPAAGMRQALRAYGKALGLAFQIRDDLLDVEVDAATAGKATGKDEKLGKATYVSLLGLEGARARLDQATEVGLRALTPFGTTAEGLAEVLHFNRERRS